MTQKVPRSRRDGDGPKPVGKVPHRTGPALKALVRMLARRAARQQFASQRHCRPSGSREVGKIDDSPS